MTAFYVLGTSKAEVRQILVHSTCTDKEAEGAAQGPPTSRWQICDLSAGNWTPQLVLLIS